MTLTQLAAFVASQLEEHECGGGGYFFTEQLDDVCIDAHINLLAVCTELVRVCNLTLDPEPTR